MKSFTYTIIDSLGIHARPAGQIVNEAKKYSSTIMIDAGEKKANAARLMAVMALGVKCGQSITVTEGVLPSNYYYTIDPSLAMSANIPFRNRLKSTSGTVVDIIENARGFYVTAEFDEPEVN